MGTALASKSNPNDTSVPAQPPLPSSLAVGKVDPHQAPMTPMSRSQQPPPPAPRACPRSPRTVGTPVCPRPHGPAPAPEITPAAHREAGPRLDLERMGTENTHVLPSLSSGCLHLPFLSREVLHQPGGVHDTGNLVRPIEMLAIVIHGHFPQSVKVAGKQRKAKK